MSERSNERYQVPAVARALAVLELLASSQTSLGISAIARRIGIPKSTCLTILSTLAASGYIRRHGDQTWSPTPRLYYVGLRSAQNVDILVSAPAVLRELRDETGLTAHLGILDGEGIVYALKVEPPGFVRFDTYPGKRASLHLTALGRTIAANMKDGMLTECLDRYRFDGGTSRAIRSEQAFLDELARIRDAGYAFENEEETVGVCCIAAPVFGHDGVIASVGITGLASDIDESSLLGLSTTVKNAARTLSEIVGGGSLDGAAAPEPSDAVDAPLGGRPQEHRNSSGRP